MVIPVILNYNTPRQTIACLDAMLSGSACPSVICIADNSSTDNSLSYIAEALRSRVGVRGSGASGIKKYNSQSFQTKSSLVHLLVNKVNGGYGYGNQEAARYLYDSGEEFNYIWILNSDTIPSAEAYENLVNFLTSQGGGLVYGTVITHRDTGRVQSCGGGFSRLTCRASHLTADGEGPLSAPNVSILTAEYPVGASMVVEKSVILDPQLFPTDLFLYYEEINLMLNLKLRTVEVIQSVVVGHICGASTGYSDLFHDRAPAINYYIYRNRLITARRIGWLSFLTTAIHSLMSLTRLGFRAGQDHICFAIEGWWHGINGITGPYSDCKKDD